MTRFMHPLLILIVRFTNKELAKVIEYLLAENRSPRFEARAAWPRASPCAAPQTLVKGRPGVRIELDVSFLEDRRHLPLIRLRRVA